MGWLVFLIAYVTVTIPLSLIVTWAGSKRTIGAGVAFLLSFFFSPLVGFIGVILSDRNVTPQKISSIDYLEQIERLKALVDKEALSDKEFEIEKQRLHEACYYSDNEQTTWSWLKYPFVTYGICFCLLLLFIGKLWDNSHKDAHGEYLQANSTIIKADNQELKSEQSDRSSDAIFESSPSDKIDMSDVTLQSFLIPSDDRKLVFQNPKFLVSVSETFEKISDNEFRITDQTLNAGINGWKQIQTIRLQTDTEYSLTYEHITQSGDTSKDYEPTIQCILPTDLKSKSTWRRKTHKGDTENCTAEFVMCQFDGGERLTLKITTQLYVNGVHQKEEDTKDYYVKDYGPWKQVQNDGTIFSTM